MEENKELKKETPMGDLMRDLSSPGRPFPDYQFWIHDEPEAPSILYEHYKSFKQYFEPGGLLCDLERFEDIEIVSPGIMRRYFELDAKISSTWVTMFGLRLFCEQAQMNFRNAAIRFKASKVGVNSKGTCVPDLPPEIPKNVDPFDDEVSQPKPIDDPFENM